MIEIGIIGEYDPGNETHIVTEDALGHSAMALGTGVDATWVSTTEITGPGDDVPGDDVGQFELGQFDGFLIAPGSPYKNLDGALRAIGHARTEDVPLLGTCGGLQHVVLELARGVLGVEDAQHAEYEPDAANLFVTPLSCSLVGQSFAVAIAPGTRAAAAYGADEATESYYCDFGLNPDRRADLEAAGVQVSGVDEQSEVRIIELPHLRFFVATLFVPQARSTLVRPHPLVTAFVAAAGAGADTPDA